jgi:hypothetical protein
MSDIDNDSVFDDDDFGNDLATVVRAPKVVMKKFDDIMDQIAPLYYAASNNSYQMDRFKVNCWYLICEQTKKENLKYKLRVIIRKVIVILILIKSILILVFIFKAYS